MKISEKDTVKLKEIRQHFEILEGLFGDLSDETRSVLDGFHDTYFSISHCVEWGATGTVEVLESIKNAK